MIFIGGGGGGGGAAAAAGLGAGGRPVEILHAGCLPVDVPPESEEAVTLELRERFGLLPVFLDADLRQAFYQGMCKQTLWPLFHSLLPLSPASPARFRQDRWEAYIKANKTFANTLTEVLQPERDFVWIHDYHLMVLPSFLRKRFHHIRCGFFLHSPFPSSEIFRTFPKREELLRSLLNTDLIGFQSFDYARHFMSCCSRMIGLEAQTNRGAITVEYFGRKVNVEVMPTGVQPEQLLEVLGTPAVAALREDLAARLRGKYVFLGIDDMDIFKGIDLKLLAFEALLEAAPEWIGRAVLVQATNPARSQSSEISVLRAEIQAIVERVNARFGMDSGYRPVEWWERSLPLEEKAALCSLADCSVLTAVRDGMNLTPYEYTVCRQGSEEQRGPRQSTLIVSEFVGCSPSLSCAIRVNPWSVEHVKDGMLQALTLTKPDQRAIHEKHWKYLKKHTVQYWAREQFNDLERVCRNHSSMRCYGLGLGLDTFRMVALDPNFSKLPTDDLVAAYQSSNRRALFLDYDGTLRPEGHTLSPAPTVEMLGFLRDLAADPRNAVVAVVSGRRKDELEDWFGDEPGIALAAEHGFYVRPAHATGGAWEELGGDASTFAWKDAVKPVLQHYVDRTDGSSVEVKDSALVWHYSRADPDLGSWQAKELLEHLDSVLASEAAYVEHGNKRVEVKPQGVGKHLAVQRLAEAAGASTGTPPLDFVFGIGDDQSNEDMFAAVEALKDSDPPPEHIVSCTMGQKPSKAHFYLDSPTSVLFLLERLIGEDAEKP